MAFLTEEKTLEMSSFHVIDILFLKRFSKSEIIVKNKLNFVWIQILKYWTIFTRWDSNWEFKDKTSFCDSVSLKKEFTSANFSKSSLDLG